MVFGMKPVKRQRTFSNVLSYWQLYVMLIIPITLLIIFSYYPMYGAQIAFKKYNIVAGIWDSPFIGLDNFTRFLKSKMLLTTLSNTLIINLYSLTCGFTLSIVLAISLNYVSRKRFKKAVQMISYAPNFISVIVMAGILFQLFNPRFGVIGQILSRITGMPVDIFAIPESFYHIFVWSGVWQGVGFGSILYISILASIPPELHEAAIADGASILQRIWHIDLPGILPVATIQLILTTGGLLNTGFEKVLLYQNSFNLQYSEVIDSYAYKIGLAASLPDHSYGAAIGLFKSVVCFILLFIVNKIAKKLSTSSLW